VLRELGFADAEVEDLLRAGVAFDERATAGVGSRGVR
jgi:hypothetical protein